jgi:hypothetical protein
MQINSGAERGAFLALKNKFVFGKIKSYYTTFLIRGEYAKKGRREI